VDLSAFVLVSSATGLLHGMGLADIAATSTFLDALALHRRDLGLPGTALAFGPWEGIEADPGHRDRLAALGLPALTAERGLSLAEEALRQDQAVLVPLHLDQGVLRTMADALPELLHGVVRVPPRQRAGADSAAALRRRLTGRGRDEREQILLELVRSHVATLLGHPSPDAVAPGQAFQELGFDSLAAVELRRRLGVATGLNLPATLVFDYPTSHAVAGYLDETFDPPDAEETASLFAVLDQLDSAIAELPPDDGSQGRVTARLEALLRRWTDRNTDLQESDVERDLDTVSDDELFEVLDQELEIS
jgi:acyl carrier protein